MTTTTVAVIPPGVTSDGALAALHGMGRCYPAHALSLANDPVSGGMRIVHDPAAAPPRDARPELRNLSRNDTAHATYLCEITVAQVKAAAELVQAGPGMDERVRFYLLDDGSIAVHQSDAYDHIDRDGRPNG